VRGHGEHRARLREPVRTRKSTPKGSNAEAPELPLRVPPLGEVHLAKARDNEPELEKPIEIYRVADDHRVHFLLSLSVVSAPAGADPFIDLLELELPKPADPVSWQFFVFNPAVDSVTRDAQMRRYFVHRVPPWICHAA